MYNDYIYINVVTQCHSQKMSLSELAEKANMTYVTLRKKLRGQSSMHLEDAFAIQKALNCGLTIEELFKNEV